jgi:uncharacterized OsmC-like protein
VGVSRAENIDLQGLVVRVKHKQNTMAPPTDHRARSVKIVALQRAIEVNGDISREESHLLLEGAEHCPVHNSLRGAIEIHTTLTVNRPSHEQPR